MTDRVSDIPVKRRSRLVMNLATVVISILFTFIALKGVDLHGAWRALRGSNYWWLIPALLAFGFGDFARALRWRSLFAPGRRPSRGATLNAMMVGYFYNNILPARAGEAARVAVLAQRSASSVMEITGTVVLERLYDLVAILVVFFVAEPWLPRVSWFGTAAIAAVVLALAIAAAAAVLAIYEDRPLRLLLRPLAWLPRLSSDHLDRAVQELTYGLSGLRHQSTALVALLWTLLGWMSSALCAYFVAIALNLHLPFAASVLVTVAIGLSMILPSPPAAIGVFEGATLIGLKAYGLSHAVALPYALVLHTVNFVPFIVTGLLLLRYNLRHPPSEPRPLQNPSLSG